MVTFLEYEKGHLQPRGNCYPRSRFVSKRGILKSLVSHFLNFKSWIKLIYDTVDVCNFVINEFNPTFKVQNMGNEAFQNASLKNASFPDEALGYSCLWA